MAESKTYQEHQEALLNMRSRPARLSYALQHFSDIRKSIERKKNPSSSNTIGRTGTVYPSMQGSRMNSEWGDLLYPKRGTDHNRAMEETLQHQETT